MDPPDGKPPRAGPATGRHTLRGATGKTAAVRRKNVVERTGFIRSGSHFGVETAERLLRIPLSRTHMIRRFGHTGPQDRSLSLRSTIWMPHTAQGLIDSRMGHPTDSKGSRSATANSKLYRSVNVATGYCPARSHLLHAIANASVRARMSASVEGQDLQILHLGRSSAMPDLTPIRRAAFRTTRLAAALLPRHARRPGRAGPGPDGAIASPHPRCLIPMLTRRSSPR
jgi:hypothetical protein